MKTTVAIYLLLFVMVTLSAWADEKRTIRLTNIVSMPYTSPDLPYGGVGSRIVTEAFAIEGINVEYGWYPTKRALSYAKEGSWDGSVGWKKTPEREQWFYFSDLALTLGIYFFYMKNFEFDWKTIDDLQGIDIGARLGVEGYGDVFLEAEKSGKISVQRTSTDLQNLKKLFAGRISILPTNKLQIFTLLQKHFTPKEIHRITYHPKPLHTTDYYLILTKKDVRNKDMIERFNSGMLKLKKSGRLNQWLNEAFRENAMEIK